MFLACWTVWAAAAAWASPEDWKADIDRFVASDAAHPPPANAVLFIGSSSIRFWTTLDRDFPGIPTINRGFGGSELADSLYYMDRIVLPYRPRAVFMYVGENDLWNGKSPETVAADFKAFRTKLHTALPETKLIYGSIKASPSRARIHDLVRRTNELIAADCGTDPRCVFVDLASAMLDAQGRPRPEIFRDDQLHLKPAGYEIWTRVLAPYLQP